MERLHTATLYLLRYGGMHPFETNRSNQTSLSVCLVLWTVFLNLVAAMSSLHYITQLVMFSSVHTFLQYMFDITWALASILIPMHFVCHARKIIAINRNLDEIIATCSIYSSKTSIKSKIKIMFLILVKIIILFCATIYVVRYTDQCHVQQQARRLNELQLRYFDGEVTNMKLSVLMIVEYHTLLLL